MSLVEIARIKMNTRYTTLPQFRATFILNIFRYLRFHYLYFEYETMKISTSYSTKKFKHTNINILRLICTVALRTIDR